jgi:hypothetical protein
VLVLILSQNQKRVRSPRDIAFVGVALHLVTVQSDVNAVVKVLRGVNCVFGGAAAHGD